jgi:GAF domain-containing protein
VNLHLSRSIALPEPIAQILTQARTPETLLSDLMPAVGEYLECDRCFIYLRNPQTRWGGVPFCWRRNVNIPAIYNEHWQLEPESLASEDPMFAAALHTEPSIFVEDVQTADDRTLNRQFEAANFGHRALIHAHLCHDGQLWGVLQPCVFDRPRHWTPVDRSTIDLLVDKITPIAVRYVRERMT